jgi:IS605 OrfB family transposase
LYGCQQVLIHPNEALQSVLEFICSEANKLTNCGIYYGRQLWFKAKRIIGKFDLEQEYKANKHFQALHSQAAQQTLRSVAEGFKSYQQLLGKFYQGELAAKPSPPHYRKKGGLALISYPKQALKLKDGAIRIPLGRLTKAWFGLDSFQIAMPTNLRFEAIRELRILPRNGCFYAEFVYQRPRFHTAVDPSRVLGIDPGLNNWLSCVGNMGKSFIIDGRKLKSLNQFYNKRVSTLKAGQPQGFWSEQLAAITEKRNRQMRDAINKAARFLINWCLTQQVGTVVFGWNQRHKDSIELGKKNNQEFVQIPTARLKELVEQLCEQYGIRFVETEESYTSKASALDGDTLPTFGAKPKGWQPSGRRGEKKRGKLHNLGRGGYQTAQGFRINADCNGALNILRKVATQLGLNLAEVGRAVLTLPKRYDVFQSLNTSYRKRCAAALQPA